MLEYNNITNTNMNKTFTQSLIKQKKGTEHSKAEKK